VWVRKRNYRLKVGIKSGWIDLGVSKWMDWGSKIEHFYEGMAGILCLEKGIVVEIVIAVVIIILANAPL